MGIGVGTPDGSTLPNTWDMPDSLLPDASPRSGEELPINGTVYSIDETPVAGATVIVTAARPFNTYTSEASPDHRAAGKRAVTDADGRFSFSGMPDDRLYHVIFLTEEFAPMAYEGIDPKRGPIEIRLPNKEAPKVDRHFAHVKLVDESGRPVPAAIAVSDGVATQTFSRNTGANGFPEQLMTGLDGEFIMSRFEPFNLIQVKIHAHGFAPIRVWIPESKDVQTIELGRGVKVRGRVVENGIPVAGIGVGIEGRSRDCYEIAYAGHFETTTDANGEFEFAHLLPSRDWTVFDITGSRDRHGALQPIPTRTGSHGSEVDLGTLTLSPTYSLRGRVKAIGSGALPPSFELAIGSTATWHRTRVHPSWDGAFEVGGLFPGQLEIKIVSRGWRFGIRNRSLDQWTGERLIGRLDPDHAEMLIEVENGYPTTSSINGNGYLPPADSTGTRPLRGVETIAGTFVDAAGTVIDAQTGAPIPSFTLLPGRKPPMIPKPKASGSILKTIVEPFVDDPIPPAERVWWDAGKKREWNNGAFDLRFEVMTSTPLLQIEADGYEAFVSDPITLSTNIAISLRPAKGPHGIVLLPNGSPAQGVTVVYAAENERFAIGKDGNLEASAASPKTVATTGSNGEFAFARRSAGTLIMVSTPAGWASARSESFHKGGKLKLKNWTSVTGVLVDQTGAPVNDAVIAARMYDNGLRSSENQITFQERAVTDASGRFLLSNVPPEDLEIVRFIPISTATGTGAPPLTWAPRLQAYASPKSGKTTDLGTIVMDTPPPAPLIDRLKEKVGL